jgi:hypothetical protein
VKSAFRSRFIPGVVLCLSAGAALLGGGYGVSLVIESLTVQGSPGGSALIFILGFFCLCTSAVVLIVFAMKLRLARRKQ